ncbi:MAG: hypothetical protein ACFWTJ_15300 [Lachnoclostridium sp.]|jgi:putative ABC transport system permease protein
MVLNKRIIRELKSNRIRYAGLFFLVVLSVSIIVGFANSTDSILYTVKTAAKENRLEDGNFTVLTQLDKAVERKIKEAGFKLEEDFYYDATLGNGKTLRLFRKRQKINRLSIVKGEYVLKKGDIIIDAHFGEKNNFDIGKTITVDDKKYTVSGYGITPDYTLVLRDNSDLLADPKHFGIGFLCKEDFKQLDQDKLIYSYSFLYRGPFLTSKEKEERINKLKAILQENTMISSFYETEDNQRTQSYADDVAINKSIAMILGTILLFIIAFILSLSIIHIIDSESPVIGALYALGYVKKDLIRHYMRLPVILVTVASFFGTFLGFSVFTGFVAESSYQYYSYPNLKTLYPPYLVIYGIVAPIGITIIVNYFVLSKRLHYTPLQLLRKDFKRERINHLKLRNLKFLTKFRIRVFLRGLGSNLTLFMGLIFATFLLLMGFGVKDSIHHYVRDVSEKTPSRYTYILNQPVELQEQQAEKAVTFTMETYYKELNQNMKITLLGIKPDSKYYKFDIKDGDKELYISSAVSKKFGLATGDTMELVDSRNNKTYALTIAGIREHINGLYVFMNDKEMNRLLGNKEDYFNTYFSDDKLDIPDEAVYSCITADDLGKVAQNMSEMMKNMIILLLVVSVLLYIIIMYLLLKMLIDKNAFSVSLMKIFGYSNREVNKLYLGSTFYTVLLSVLIALPVDYKVYSLLWPGFITNVNGFIFIKINPFTYVVILFIAIVSYVVTQELLKHRLRKISFLDVLKNRE